MSEKEESMLPEATPEQQAEFDAIYRNVLLACDEIVFGRPGSSERFAEMLSGQENVDKYYKMRMELKLQIKSGSELGIKTRLNG